MAVSLWTEIFQTKLVKEEKREIFNNIDLMLNGLKDFEFPTLLSTYDIEIKDLGVFNSFLSRTKSQLIYPIVMKKEDILNIQAIEDAKKIKMKNLAYIYPVFDNAEAYFKEEAKDNHLKLIGAIASTGSRWGFDSTTGTIHGKTFSDVLPANIKQSTFSQLISAGCSVYTNRKGSTFFTESEDGKFFDFWHNVYWLINELQITAFNYIKTTPSKIPYNEIGLDGVRIQLSYVLDQAVANRSVGAYRYKSIAGSPPNEAEILEAIAEKGYYIKVKPINPETAKTRIAPVIDIWVHMLGSVHKMILNIGILK